MNALSKIKSLLSSVVGGILFILAIPLMIMLIPIAGVVAVVDLPFKRKRQSRLNEIIKHNWIPSHKYIYITYIKENALAKYIEEVLMNDYGQYIIADVWSEADQKWTMGAPDKEKRIGSVIGDIAGDFDGDFSMIMLMIDPETLTLDKKSLMTLVDEEENKLFLLESKVSYSNEDVAALITNKIKQTVNSFAKRNAAYPDLKTHN